MWWTASDVGWVVGHSYIVYAPLITGATTVLYEGKPVGTPDAGAFWRVIAEHGVEALFTAPTAIRAIKKEDPDGQAARRATTSAGFRTLFLAGERLDPETYHWADRAARRAGRGPLVADRDRLADRGEPARPRPDADQARLADGAGARLPRARSSTSRAAPVAAGRRRARSACGCRCRRARCRRCGATTSGSSSSYLSAFDGYYLSGDGGYLDEDGYLFVMGRTDDVINVAGHRLSTGSMEAVLASHPAVAECAVIGVADPMKGQVPRGLRGAQGRAWTPTRTSIGTSWSPWCATRSARWRRSRTSRSWPALPKTRSGKILRKTMREIADGKDAAVPSTIEDPTVLDTAAAGAAAG